MIHNSVTSLVSARRLAPPSPGGILNGRGKPTRVVGMLRLTAMAAVLVLETSHPAAAAVIEFSDRSAWEEVVRGFTTIDFTGYPEGTFITDQYAASGVLFAGGNDSIHSTPSFVNDGWGLDGNGEVVLSFAVPQRWIGVDYPGFVRIELSLKGELVYSSSDFLPGGVGNFAGLLSDKAFDAATLIDPAGEAEIDDLHFGVPTPASLWLVTLAVMHYLGSRSARHAPSSGPSS